MYSLKFSTRGPWCLYKIFRVKCWVATSNTSPCTETLQEHCQILMNSQFRDGRWHKHTDARGWGLCILHGRCSRRRRRTVSPPHMLFEPCKFLFGKVRNQLVQGIVSGILHLLLLQKFLAAEVPSSKVLQDSTLSVLRCSLVMQIVYTQPHKIYYLSRVRRNDDRPKERGMYKVTIRGI